MNLFTIDSWTEDFLGNINEYEYNCNKLKTHRKFKCDESLKEQACC